MKYPYWIWWWLINGKYRGHKLFFDHTEMKVYSTKHSANYKRGYESGYDKIEKP